MKRRFFLEDTGRFFPPHSPQPGKDISTLCGCDLSVTSSFSFLIREKKFKRYLHHKSKVSKYKKFASFSIK
jgi:hypothetical protein